MPSELLSRRHTSTPTRMYRNSVNGSKRPPPPLIINIKNTICPLDLRRTVRRLGWIFSTHPGLREPFSTPDPELALGTLQLTARHRGYVGSQPTNDSSRRPHAIGSIEVLRFYLAQNSLGNDHPVRYRLCVFRAHPSDHRAGVKLREKIRCYRQSRGSN